MFVLQFINTGLILLVVNINFNFTFWGIPIFNGDYTELN